jgi:hypothetical protein
MPTRACEFLYLCDALSLRTGVWRYITRRAAAAAYTQCMWDFYIALLLYTCACASSCISQSDCLGGPQKKATCILLYYKHFPVCCNSYYIYYLNICTLIGPLFLCVLGCRLYASYDNFFFWICASSWRIYKCMCIKTSGFYDAAECLHGVISDSSV